MNIAILDDYQQAAFLYADWSWIRKHHPVTVFPDHLSDEQELVERLMPFDAICVMRERTPLTASILKRLTNLQLIVSTGGQNPSIDEYQAHQQGVFVANTGYLGHGVIELTWGLILSLAKHLPGETSRVRAGDWQGSVGNDLRGKTLGILGLGSVGTGVAVVGKAFGMRVIAWSDTLSAGEAHSQGVSYVTREQLFAESDYLSIHLVLSERSIGMVGRKELGRMKRTAFLINTSRGPLVDEAALIEVLEAGAIAGAGLDVFDAEPLPASHPFRRLANVIATPHIGYVTADLYKLFFTDTVAILEQWLKK